MRNIWLWFGAALCMCSIAVASPKSNPHFFSASRAQVQLTTTLFRMQVEAGMLNEAAQTTSNARADLDKMLAKAMVEAKGHPALLNAFKDFYLAAQNYCAEIDPSTPVIIAKAEMSRRQAELDSKGNAMMLEAKMVGYIDE